MRFVALDTETTGLNFKGKVSNNHRIIEIACVEIEDGKITGKEFHTFLNPKIKISKGAERVHGVGDKDLQDKPEFKDIVDDFLSFLKGAHVVIHNAPFDIAFIDKEFNLLNVERQPCSTFYYIDTLKITREMFPGEDNTLEAVCKRFDIERRGTLHGALEDARMLAKLFLYMG